MRGTNIRGIASESAGDRARVWIHDDQLAFGLFTEKIAGGGEDADPILFMSSPQAGRQLLAVFDGMGGAGSGRVTCDDGVERTQAYLASRLVRGALSDRCERMVDGQQFEVDDLRADITQILQDWRDRWQLEGRSTLKGGLRRTLPTTMAAAMVNKTSNQAATVTAFWAGDSRAYLLTPRSGLQQLTADHTRVRDVLSQLTDDPPISNVVSASQSFSIEQHRVSIDEPFVVVCATDGVFGYVQTPGQVEYHLLETLDRARDVREWAHLLVERVLGYTADDATLVLSAIGFRDLGQLQTLFRERMAHVHATQVFPFVQVAAADYEAVRSVRQATWDDYRDVYTSLMPTTPPPPRGT